jgi:hypothetical protein
MVYVMMLLVAQTTVSAVSSWFYQLLQENKFSPKMAASSSTRLQLSGLLHFGFNKLRAEHIHC